MVKMPKAQHRFIRQFRSRQRRAFEIPRNAWDAALTSIHPAVELRIEALEGHCFKAPDAVEDVTAKRVETMFGILVVLAALAVSPPVPGWHGHSNWWW